MLIYLDVCKCYKYGQVHNFFVLNHKILEKFRRVTNGAKNKFHVIEKAGYITCILFEKEKMLITTCRQQDLLHQKVNVAKTMAFASTKKKNALWKNQKCWSAAFSPVPMFSVGLCSVRIVQ